MPNELTRVFLSYRFNQKDGVYSQWYANRVAYYLKKQPFLHIDCWAEQEPPPNWAMILGPMIDRADWMVLFAGKDLGRTQRREYNRYLEQARNAGSGKQIFVVQLEDTLPDDIARSDFKAQYPPTSDIFTESTGWASEWRQRKKDIDEYDARAQKCASKIAQKILRSAYKGTGAYNDGVFRKFLDGLPFGYLFDYEKRIISAFAKNNGIITDPTLLQNGCPPYWPTVKTRSETDQIDNPLAEGDRGKFRGTSDQVVVDARKEFHRPTSDSGPTCCLARRELTFPEAGPRRKIVKKLITQKLRVGIVVLGGIAPGSNAVLTGIYNRHKLYFDRLGAQKQRRSYTCQLKFYYNGFSGLLSGQSLEIRMAKGKPSATPVEVVSDLQEQTNKGGARIGTSRYDSLLSHKGNSVQERQEDLEKLANKVISEELDILYIVGGDGSMRAAHAISETLDRLRNESLPKKTKKAKDTKQKKQKQKKIKEVSIIAIPKTMDNDILWVWQSFGFLSAVEKSKELVMSLATEAKSNPRLCVAQLFGSDSGFVVSHAAMASGACKAALIPEFPFTLYGLSEHLKERLSSEPIEGQLPNGIILMAETAIPEDVEDYVDNPRYSEAKNDEGPILELTEREKTEIRRFIASARINVGDISNLKKMCKIIGAWNSRTQPYRIGSNSDLKKLKACFAGISQISGTTEAEVLAARKINDIIISHSLFSLGDWPASERSTIAKQIYSHVSLIEPLADDPLLQDKLDAEGARKNFVEAFQALRTFDLQHECRRIIDRLCDFYKEREYETVPPPISRNVLKNKILRVVHRILELVHRLILDDLLNGSLDKRSDVSKQRRVTGQTRDELRTGGLKIVSRVLARDIQEQGKKWKRFRVFTNEPRHLIRAIDPSVTDVVFGQRLGTLAVDNAMAGYTGFMVSQWLTEYVLVPLELAILGRKRVPENGIFWKSVMAGTGQDAAKISEFKVMDSVRSEFASNQ